MMLLKPCGVNLILCLLNYITTARENQSFRKQLIGFCAPNVKNIFKNARFFNDPAPRVAIKMPKFAETEPNLKKGIDLENK